MRIVEQFVWRKYSCIQVHIMENITIYSWEHLYATNYYKNIIYLQSVYLNVNKIYKLNYWLMQVNILYRYSIWQFYRYLMLESKLSTDWFIFRSVPSSVSQSVLPLGVYVFCGQFCSAVSHCLKGLAVIVIKINTNIFEYLIII